LKKRRKNKGKRKARKPDEYFAAGPFEFARFGKTMISRSRMTGPQFDAMQSEAAKQYPTIVAEINALVLSIAQQITHLPPDRLLHRGWWEFATTMIGIGPKRYSDSDRLAAMRMVDYVQSVIASAESATYAEDLSEEAWNKLRSDVETLFRRLTLEYQICLTAHRKAQDPNLDMGLEEFRFQTETLWMNIRGKRYHVHERQALLDILAPHSDILVKLFGLDAQALVDEFDKILTKLTSGLDTASHALIAFREDTLNQVEELAGKYPDLNFDALMEKVFEDENLAARRDAVMGEMFGFDLFDVAKNTSLPASLVDPLTWSPGEDTEFFAPGDFSGWPLRIWPIMKRPFIRLHGRSFCFDIFSLFDNLYRILRRLILQLEPSYSDTWNDRQKAVTEDLPFIHLMRILPGAQLFRPVYYRWKAGNGPAQWHEADGILIYCDHLFVVEVKGGAFTYTSPANDLPAHLASLKNLLQEPARQGSRFVDYLESAPEVALYDANHAEIAKLKRADFRQVTVCAVTLDAFTSLAARAQHLTKVGISIGSRAVWSVSIDDLRVFSDIFDNPLTFLHFVEQRALAGQSKFVDLHDEMDHLGLYFARNNYSQHAAELMSDGFDRLDFDGFRTPIDEYFGAVIRGDPPSRPQQEMPLRLVEIVDFLARSNEPNRARLASFLLNAGDDFRKTFAETIAQALRENNEFHRARPLSVYGDMAMTLYVWSPGAPRDADAAKEHTRTVISANDETRRPLVELEYDQERRPIGAHLTEMTLVGLSATELERIKAAGAALGLKRVRQVQRTGKIGRNEPCPCGSGKKFKRCHGAAKSS